ncbi:hypothetical protein RTH46_22615 [Pseudomonas sp. zfem004]|uniref:hypothetical protein n=1 Tax=unclassified Pseudomonas TaxID=196821 RepID=UPI00129AC0CB|nr:MULTISPECIES: hypothetical protein [unclassified Pseudomonas]MDU9405286.1 hypothetical protein [Pseudomonas sp. zfem004]
MDAPFMMLRTLRLDDAYNGNREWLPGTRGIMQWPTRRSMAKRSKLKGTLSQANCEISSTLAILTALTASGHPGDPIGAL